MNNPENLNTSRPAILTVQTGINYAYNDLDCLISTTRPIASDPEESLGDNKINFNNGVENSFLNPDNLRLIVSLIAWVASITEAQAIRKVTEYGVNLAMLWAFNELDVLQDENGNALISAKDKLGNHHIIPTEILNELPGNVAGDPRVRGQRGNPNRWPIPYDVHRVIHIGQRGGMYNMDWKDRVQKIKDNPRVEDIVKIRNEIIKKYDLEQYRP